MKPLGIVFETLSGSVFDVFKDTAKEVSYDEGAVIFEEDSTSDKFFVIKEGEVEIRKIISKDENRYKLIAILTQGDLFGEMAVFQGLPRSAQAVAKAPVSLLSVDKDSLVTVFKENPEVAAKISGFLAFTLMERLRNTTEELTAVYETGRLVTTSRTPNELASAVVSRVMVSVEQATSGVLVLWNEFNSEFAVEYSSDPGILQGTVLDKNDPLVLCLQNNREPILSFDLSSDDRIPQPEGSPYAGASLVAAPFLSADKLIGFIALISKDKKKAFSQSQMVLLSAIGGYVSIAIENLKFIQEELDRARLNKNKSMLRF